jgi:hypothetical protein
VLDLRDGTRHSLAGVDLGRWGWLADGRLVWAEGGTAVSRPSIRAWRPGEDATTIAIDAPAADFATLEVSPDARRILVRASHRDGDRFVTDLLAILDPSTGRWQDVPDPDGLGNERWTWGTWASSSSIVLQAPDRHPRLVQLDP